MVELLSVSVTLSPTFIVLVSATGSSDTEQLAQRGLVPHDLLHATTLLRQHLELVLLDGAGGDLLDDADGGVTLRADAVDPILSLLVLDLTEALLHEQHGVRAGERDALR